MLDFCARHGIEPVVEMFPRSRVNEALDRLREDMIRCRAVPCRAEKRFRGIRPEGAWGSARGCMASSPSPCTRPVRCWASAPDASIETCVYRELPLSTQTGSPSSWIQRPTEDIQERFDCGWGWCLKCSDCYRLSNLRNSIF